MPTLSIRPMGPNSPLISPFWFLILLAMAGVAIQDTAGVDRRAPERRVIEVGSDNGRIISCYLEEA